MPRRSEGAARAFAVVSAALAIGSARAFAVVSAALAPSPLYRHPSELGLRVAGLGVARI